MTSIGSQYNNYYQLSSFAGNSGSTGAAGAYNSISQILSGNDAPSTSNDAFFLDLSPEAQKYLSNSVSDTKNDRGLSTNFLLSSKQQDTISAILTKYKDAPFTQDTFNEIQNDLKAAGLGTDTLSLQEKTKAFNPISVLMAAISGESTDQSSQNGTTDANLKVKSDNYIKQVISQWQNISTTFND